MSDWLKPRFQWSNDPVKQEENEKEIAHYKSLSWRELTKYATDRGINTHKLKRVEIEHRLGKLYGK